MELYIFDENRNLIGVLESYEYFRWTRRYSTSGSFELKAIATPINTELLTLGKYLWKSDDEEAGVIEYVEMTMSETELVTAKGRFVTSFLTRRIIWGTEILNGSLSDCIGKLLNNHLINPSNFDRKIDFISYTNEGITDSVKTQISYRNLMNAVTRLCDTADVGIKTVFDPITKSFTVKLYKGVESQAVFSREYENLINQSYTQNISDYANVALVGGEGEGPSRIFAVTGTGSGIERRETFVDARDLNSEEFGGDYMDALVFRGQSRLSELTLTRSFDAAINPHSNLEYKIDFDLGDIVKVISKEWNVSLTTRITEIEESYGSDGQSLNIVFGKGMLTLIQKLKGGDS